MKIEFIIFFGIALLIYGSVHFYIFIRGWQACAAAGGVFQVFYAVVFWALALSFIAGRVLENYVQNGYADAVVWMGSLWLSVMVYLFFFVLMLDLGRFLFTVFGNTPSQWTDSYESFKFFIGAFGFLLALSVTAFGFWNARTPVVKELEIVLEKEGGEKKEWTIVVASDIHLGTIVHKNRAEALVASVNALKPDLVLFAGDTIDEDIRPVIRRDIGESLKKISSRYGIYAITGNHEYIGGADAAVKYLEDHGITMLRDSYALIGDGLYVVGREDLSVERFAGIKRKSIDELFQGVDISKPIIILDHQPFSLDAVARDGRADIQFSGHTHHGQLWPFNFITEIIYELSWGHKRMGNTEFYVSSGWGTWGPPIRVGNTPELVRLKLKLQ